MPSATALSVAAGPATAQAPELPDELLEYIFLRLDDASDLARASAACTSFRRVVSGRRFLRRFPSLHRPPVLGFLDCSDACCGLDFHPAQPRRRSASAARAVARCGDFTSSFLADDDPKRWRVCDARDGRLLLAKTTPNRWFVFDAFAVYDPLHRRHVQIPPVPGDLVASAVPCGGRQHFEAFLAPAADEAEEAATSLQVICNVFSDSSVVAFVYSPAATGSWRCVTSFNIQTFRWMRYPELLRRRYAYSCFFWTDHAEKAMLALDTREMKFCVVDLPPESEGRDKTVVEADELRLGLFIIVGERTLSLYTTVWRDRSGGVDGAKLAGWRHERMIALPDGHWSVSRGAASEGYILLRGIPPDQGVFGA